MGDSSRFGDFLLNRLLRIFFFECLAYAISYVLKSENTNLDMKIPNSCHLIQLPNNPTLAGRRLVSRG